MKACGQNPPLLLKHVTQSLFPSWQAHQVFMSKETFPCLVLVSSVVHCTAINYLVQAIVNTKYDQQFGHGTVIVIVFEYKQCIINLNPILHYFPNSDACQI